MLAVFLALTCSANTRPKGHKALAKKTAAPNFNKGLAKNAACGAYQRHSLDALSVAALKTIDAQFAASKTVGGLLGRIFG